MNLIDSSELVCYHKTGLATAELSKLENFHFLGFDVGCLDFCIGIITKKWIYLRCIEESFALFYHRDIILCEGRSNGRFCIICARESDILEVVWHDDETISSFETDRWEPLWCQRISQHCLVVTQETRRAVFFSEPKSRQTPHICDESINMTVGFPLHDIFYVFFDTAVSEFFINRASPVSSYERASSRITHHPRIRTDYSSLYPVSYSAESSILW